ncbi:MAG: hypothetical protein JST86_16570 [Bacteroidetes bacterium]|nr:hypothetical protein [Bacteroidota bacterium]
MSRKLEKFIGDHRNEFDDAMPSGKVWDSINAGLQGDHQKKKAILAPLYKWSIAAAVVIIAGISIFLAMQQNKTTTPPGFTQNGSGSDDTTGINAIAVESEPEVNQFAQLVLMKQEELKALAPAQPELYRQFTTDINQLDSSYKSLKSQLSTSPNREVLIQAMIQNLQLQLNVLNQQLTIINQIKQSKNDSHEKGEKFM